jgi:pimeloyl-ACP methyl ester carboxylesterase
MKRGIAILLSLGALMGVGYFTASKWAIHHTTLILSDPLRTDREVAVDIAVRRDKEWEATAEMITLPVVILSHGNTVRFTEYSFLANVFAARGYMVVSIQHDLETDEPMVTKVGEPYVGRGMQYNRGIANIMFAIDQLKKLQPNSDYRHLTMVGHSNGGDISMYFAAHHPELISKVITLDNLRVPFVVSDKMKILSFRSHDPNFQTDPGVLPTPQQAKTDGIDIVNTQFQHTWMSDRGPESAKETIQTTLDHFLSDSATSDLSPAPTDKPLIAKLGPGPYP